MTENLLQKLEEKMVTLISEVEDLRKEIQHLNYENAALRAERDNNTQKLQDLISLVDSINVATEIASVSEGATSIAA